MPYWNDPKRRTPHDSSLGWIDSGLSYVARKHVPQDKEAYPIHNRRSEFKGAIVVQGMFYIHGGPVSLSRWGWAAGGCVEVVGSFDEFRRDILDLAGSTEADIQKGMKALVAARRLDVQYDLARPPTSSPGARENETRTSAEREQGWTSSPGPRTGARRAHPPKRR